MKQAAFVVFLFISLFSWGQECANNEIKYTDEWYEPMLELETKACAMEEFKKVSFFNNLIFTKA